MAVGDKLKVADKETLDSVNAKADLILQETRTASVTSVYKNYIDSMPGLGNFTYGPLVDGTFVSQPSPHLVGAISDRLNFLDSNGILRTPPTKFLSTRFALNTPGGYMDVVTTVFFGAGASSALKAGVYEWNLYITHNKSGAPDMSRVIYSEVFSRDIRTSDSSLSISLNTPVLLDSSTPYHLVLEQTKGVGQYLWDFRTGGPTSPYLAKYSSDGETWSDHGYALGIAIRSRRISIPSNFNLDYPIYLSPRTNIMNLTNADFVFNESYTPVVDILDSSGAVLFTDVKPNTDLSSITSDTHDMVRFVLRNPASLFVPNRSIFYFKKFTLHCVTRTNDGPSNPVAFLSRLTGNTETLNVFGSGKIKNISTSCWEILAGAGSIARGMNLTITIDGKDYSIASTHGSGNLDLNIRFYQSFSIKLPSDTNTKAVIVSYELS